MGASEAGSGGGFDVHTAGPGIRATASQIHSDGSAADLSGIGKNPAGIVIRKGSQEGVGSRITLNSDRSFIASSRATSRAPCRMRTPRGGSASRFHNCATRGSRSRFPERTTYD